jgi:Uma2 family endonuclease
MGEVGILTPEDRVELIEGELIQMAPISPEHAGAVGALTHDLVRRVGDRALIRVALPVRLDAHSEPEPDFALVLPRQDHYRQAHPTPADILLLIEVAQTSLAFDRTAKLRLYAAHGIREYWIVNLPERCIEICRDPAGDRYASVTRAAPEATLEPLALPGLRLSLRDILG